MLLHALLPSNASYTWLYLNTFLLGALVCYLLYALSLLYLHPLASFRGPRRAALSTWWLHFVSKTGRADQIFEELHRKYNTRALRIGPNEIHISDSTLYHTLYSQDHAFAKHSYFYAAFGTPHSLFVETDRSLHRQRRKMLNNFFSKSSIRGMQNLLHPKVEMLCNVMTEVHEQGPLNVYNAARCMTVDVITELSFGCSFNLMGNVNGTNFGADFLHAFDLVSNSIWDLMYFPLTRSVLQRMPTSLTIWLGGPTAHFQLLTNAIQDAVTRFRVTKAAGKCLNHDVVFERLSELDNQLMLAEATDILVAGSDTTATTLAVALHQLTRNPEAYAPLKYEIRRANLKTVEDYDLKSIEQLPYLSACVKEALRFATAVPGRLPRVVPPPQPGAAPLTVDGKVIPPGSVVGISAYTVHTDEEIWGADARAFNPKRWLEPEAKQLEKYLVTFSKGARQCLGMNLAYAELTLALAMITTRFDLTLDETMSKGDLEFFDGFTAGYRGTGPRLNVFVL